MITQNTRSQGLPISRLPIFPLALKTSKPISYVFVWNMTKHHQTTLSNKSRVIVQVDGAELGEDGLSGNTITISFLRKTQEYNQLSPLLFCLLSQRLGEQDQCRSEGEGLPVYFLCGRWLFCLFAFSVIRLLKLKAWNRRTCISK